MTHNKHFEADAVRQHSVFCRVRGPRREQAVSRFVLEFDDHLKENIVISDRVRRKEPEPDPQLSLL